MKVFSFCGSTLFPAHVLARGGLIFFKAGVFLNKSGNGRRKGAAHEKRKIFLKMYTNKAEKCTI